MPFSQIRHSASEALLLLGHIAFAAENVYHDQQVKIVLSSDLADDDTIYLHVGESPIASARRMDYGPNWEVSCSDDEVCVAAAFEE